MDKDVRVPNVILEQTSQLLMDNLAKQSLKLYAITLEMDGDTCYCQHVPFDPYVLIDFYKARRIKIRIKSFKELTYPAKSHDFHADDIAADTGQYLPVYNSSQVKYNNY